MYLGENLRLIREKWRVTQDEFSQLLGITRGMLAQYETRGSTPKHATAKRIRDVVGCDIDVLEKYKLSESNIPVMQNEDLNILEKIRSKELIRIPKESIKQKHLPLIPESASAGQLVGFMDSNGEDIPRYYVPGFQDCDLLVPVAGDSMYPDYASGDIIAVKRITDPTFIQWGHAHLIDTPQGLVLKNIEPVEIDENRVSLVSVNNKLKHLQYIFYVSAH